MHFWRHALHDGFIAGTSMLDDARPIGADAASATAPTASHSRRHGDRLPSRSHILDGRYANNGWLQEMPKPLSKVTWDNVAYISPATAEKLGIPVTRPGNQDNDLLEITYQNRKAVLPVWVLPGTADDVIAVHFGYGRRKAGRVGTNIGHDVFGLRSSDSALVWIGARRSRRPARGYMVTSTQNHFAMEGRNPVRVVDAEEYKANPKAVEELGHEKLPTNAVAVPAAHL